MKYKIIYIQKITGGLLVTVYSRKIVWLFLVTCKSLLSTCIRRFEEKTINSSKGRNKSRTGCPNATIGLIYSLIKKNDPEIIKSIQAPVRT